MTPREFIAALTPAAQACHAKTGIPASFTIAQAALESAWGESGLTKSAMNLFGIKADAGWAGPFVEMGTAEFRDGERVMEPARFRKYDDWQGSIDDHARFLIENRRYRNAFTLTTGEEWAHAVAAAGYATDPAYAAKLINLIQTHNLAALDVQEPAPIVESQPVEIKPAEEKPMAPLIAAILPSLISAVPDLMKIFGSGSEVATRNTQAAEKVVEMATKVTKAVNAQQAAELIASDPAMRDAFQQEVKTTWYELVGEAGGGGISGARAADEARQASGKPFWRSATFAMGCALLPLVYFVVISVTMNLGGGWEPAVRASIATGVVTLVLGAIVGYYYGASRNAGIGTPLPQRN